MNAITEINSCEVCGNKQLHPVLNLGLQPLCDDLVPFDDARICNEYPIEILFCPTCFTSHQRFQVPKQELFPTTYHYRSRFTQDVLNGMSSLVDACEKRLSSLQQKTIVDIGCNDGSLLDFFRKKGAVTIGIEPTSAYADAKKNGHVIYNAFLTEEVTQDILKKQGKADIITFTNVFAHIENLTEVLSALQPLLAPHTLLVIENHYLGAILKGNQFDTFYHEHPRTYSYTSFEYIAKSLGIALLDAEFPSRYGGNIRVFLGNTAYYSFHHTVENGMAIKNQESFFLSDFIKLQAKIFTWQKTKKNALMKKIKQEGKLQAKAFPGRCAIIIKLLNLTEEHISAVYEKPGSLKIGHYVPGTRIPIVSDDDLFTESKINKPLLNLAWHISTEIHQYMKGNTYKGHIFDIIMPDDFVLNVP